MSARPPHANDLATQSRWPNLLIIDTTRLGDGTATGDLKATLLAPWPKANVMQVFARGRRLLVNGGPDPTARSGLLSNSALFDAIDAFAPDLIVYRPLPEARRLNEFALSLLVRADIPFGIWIMDDWPARLAVSNPGHFARFDRDLRTLLSAARVRFSACEAMSEAYKVRYGLPFHAAANGVDPKDWPEPAPGAADAPFRLRYAGSIAADMTLSSLARIAEVVEDLSKDGSKIVFEIKTKPYWRDIAEPHFRGLTATHFNVEQYGTEQYRGFLSGADAVVIAYNFDESSQTYVRYSMANKLPECLACGAPIFGHGPAGVATIDYLLRLGCASVVTDSSRDSVARALHQLMADPAERWRMGRNGREIAFSRHDRAVLAESFCSVLSAAANISADSMKRKSPGADTGPPILTFSRDQHMTVDETDVVAELFASRRGSRHVMVDVGAHWGGAAAPFVSLGWRVLCFEPEPTNRAQLEGRFGASPRVIIDPRAVGETAETGRSLYASEESDGISGMLKFRDSHKEIAKVDVTTIADAVETHRLPQIDFLKVDVEGFDFAVLKGVPWETMKPDVVVCEFEDAKTSLLGHGTQDIADFLLSKGYTVYISEWHPIVAYGTGHDWHRLVRYPDAKPPRESWGNILAFIDDPGAAALSHAFAAGLRSSIRGPLQRAYSWVATTIESDSPRLLPLGRSLMRGLRTARLYALFTCGWIAAVALAALLAFGLESLRTPLLVLLLGLAAAAPFLVFPLIGRFIQDVNALRFEILSERARAADLEDVVRNQTPPSQPSGA